MKDGDVMEIRHLRRRDPIPEGWHVLPQDVSQYHAQFSILIGKDEMTAPLPDDNPKTAHGVAKPGFHGIPAGAILHMGRAFQNGLDKQYGLANWRDDRVSASTYYNAVLRHMLAWWDGQDDAPDSGVHHLAHVMACCAILLDADELGKLNDDRPRVGNFAEIVARLTKDVAA